MPQYKIYAGLGGSFGGAKYHQTVEAANDAEAGQIAYETAVQNAEAYTLQLRIRTVDQIMEEDGLDEEEAQAAYLEELESWLAYHFELVS